MLLSDSGGIDCGPATKIKNLFWDIFFVGKQNFGAVLGIWGKKNIARAAPKKEKIWGTDFNNAPAGNIIIPREFFNSVSC